MGDARVKQSELLLADEGQQVRRLAHPAGWGLRTAAPPMLWKLRGRRAPARPHPRQPTSNDRVTRGRAYRGAQRFGPQPVWDYPAG